MKKQKVTVVQNEEQPIERNALAASIMQMSSAVKALRKGGITFDAIVTLTHRNCRSVGKGWRAKKPSEKTVHAVLDALESLVTFTTKS